MDRKKSNFESLVFTGLAGLLLFSACASKPVEKLTPQQLILQNRKAEATAVPSR